MRQKEISLRWSSVWEGFKDVYLNVPYTWVFVYLYMYVCIEMYVLYMYLYPVTLFVPVLLWTFLYKTLIIPVIL